MLVEIAQVSKSFRVQAQQVDAVQDLSLQLDAGQFVAIQGPSGSGKTTTLLMLGGLLRPDRGKVLLEGVDVYGLSPNERARLRAQKIGFVFQQFHLIPYLTVLENVMAAGLGLPGSSAERTAYASQLITQLGLAARIAHLPGQLSTGERQRVALARAMVNRPTLVLADEPTGNLDEENAGIVLGFLARFAEEGGCTLLITHDATAASYAQSIRRMQAGQLLTADAAPK